MLVATSVLGLSACSVESEAEAESAEEPGSSASKSAAPEEPKAPPKPERPQKPERPLTVAFLGDSYVDGEGAKRPETTRWTTRVSKRFDWKEVNLGLGGTGYTTPGPEENATTYVQRVDAVKEADPDVVVVSGGRNDVLASPERIRAKAVELFKALKQLKGSPEVVVVGPLWDARPPNKRFTALERAVEAAARKVGVKYVGVPRQPLVGRPKLMASDRIHPTAAGYAVITRSLATPLKAAVEGR